MANNFNDIIKLIDKSIANFNKNIPGIQGTILDDVVLQIKRLDLDAKGDIKTTVANIKIINSIKQKLNKLIMTDDYISSVKDFVKVFNEIAVLQNEYWASVEKEFKPKPLLREIRTQAIDDTANNLTENGIGVNVKDKIVNILRTNITSGGSYKQLESQLRESLTDTKQSEGILSRYTRQVTTDAINQYSAQYTKAVSDSLSFEWFAYQGSDIVTTRPFCDAMTDRRYFHITEVPSLLKATDLYYVNKKTGKKELVPIYSKTGLPAGMYPNENADNFFILRGGYNCGHQIRPVSEDQVPLDIVERVKATVAYKNFKRA